jgi:tetratricopeptide (TPR) repeat protein
MKHLLLAVLLLAPLSAWAAQGDPRLDDLFAKLEAAPNAEAAKPLEAEIWQVWAASPSPTVEVLLGNGSLALGQDEHAKALEIFTALVETAPDFAEGWNKRATVHFHLGDLLASVEDIERALLLEPRHFGALAGLGTIMERLNDKPKALAAWERALAVNPHIEGGQEKLRELVVAVRGRPI